MRTTLCIFASLCHIVTTAKPIALAYAVERRNSYLQCGGGEPEYRITSAIEQRFRDLAGDGIGRIEHVTDLIFDALPQQQVCAGHIPAIVALKPAGHFGRG